MDLDPVIEEMVMDIYDNRNFIGYLDLMNFKIMIETKQWLKELIKKPKINIHERNEFGYTPLLASALSTTTKELTYHLLQDGADFRATTKFNENILHFTEDPKTIDMIVQLDYNLINSMNIQCKTPLHYACELRCDNKIHQLLYYNADVMLTDRWNLPLFKAIKNRCNDTVVGILFNYTIDRHDTTHDFCLFAETMYWNSPFVPKLIEMTDHLEVFVDDWELLFYTLACDHEQFKLFVEKFDNDLSQEEFKIYPYQIAYLLDQCLSNNKKPDMILLNSQFLFDTQFEITDGDIISKLLDLIHYRRDKLNDLTEIICFYASYGYPLTIEHLIRVYLEYGDCELFRMLLHMDPDFTINGSVPVLIMPFLIINDCLSVSETIQYFEDTLNHDPTVRDLIRFTALIKPYLLHYDHDGDDNYVDRNIVKNAKQLPNVPLLVELARNQCRVALVQQFHIKTCCDFYTIVKSLPIPDRIRRIITFEIPLYGRQD